jgi:hypothetical protein
MRGRIRCAGSKPSGRRCMYAVADSFADRHKAAPFVQSNVLVNGGPALTGDVARRWRPVRSTYSSASLSTTRGRVRCHGWCARVLILQFGYLGHDSRDSNGLARDARALRLSRGNSMLVHQFQAQRSIAKTPLQVLRLRPPEQEGDSGPTTEQRYRCVLALAL